MVIERALEKLRQGASSAASSHAAAKQSSAAARQSSAPAAVLTADLPVFPVVNCSHAVAIAHRILVPDALVGRNERVAAAYRMVRTRLLHRSRNHGLKSIAITSAGPGEGKSLTALNLALSLARDPTVNVFLLDLDMRSPSMCAYLGVQPPVELLSYFTGSRAASEVFFTVGPKNLALAGSVSSTDAASELLGSGRLEALLSYINSLCANAIILLDLPPVLVTDEALLVAPRVDATLLVVAEGRTRRDSLARAVSLLAEFKCIGVVLNHATEALEDNAYYYYNK
jgi:capsular exopolysaccharide synthesis family protein